VKCDRIRARLVAFLLGEVSQRESNRIASHIGNCPSCLEELDSLQLTVGLLQGLPQERLSPSFEEQLAARLAVLRESGENARPALRTPGPGALRRIAVGGAALAGTALILMLTVFRPSLVVPESHPAPRRVVTIPRRGAPSPNRSTPLASVLVQRTKPTQVAKVSPLGRIVGIAGEPRLRASGEKSWHVCLKEDPIPGVAALMTAETDRAEIELPDGSRIRLDYDTHLEMARATGAGSGVRSAKLNLRSGTIWLLLTRGQAGMVVSTPTATVEALGGFFRLSAKQGAPRFHGRLEGQQAGAEPETNIAVVRGTAKLSNQHGMITVAEGDCARLQTGKPIALPDAAGRLEAIRLQVPWGQKGFLDWAPEPLSWADAFEKLAGGRARLGVELEPTPMADAPSATGLGVTKVLAGSPAEKAGIKPGDRLVRVDELMIASREDLARSELLFSPGQHLPLLIERAGQSLQLTAALAEPGVSSLRIEGDALERANRRFAMKETAEAMRAYKEMVAKGEQESAALNNLGVAYEFTVRAKSAVAAYREAVRLSPKVAQYRFNLALGFFRIGNLPRAADELEAALASDSAFADARFLLGRIWALSGEYEAAMEQARSLQTSPASSARGYCLMGEIAMLRGEPKEAESWYLRAAETDPLYLDPRVYLARTCFIQERLDEARTWVESALRLDPSSLQALNGLGLVLFRQRRLDEAEQVLRKAAALHPESGKVYNNLALVYLGGRDLAASEAAYRKAVALAPDATWCHYGLAVALEHSHRLAEAKRECAVALRLDPTYEPASQRLASLYRRSGEVQLAANILDRARRYSF